MMNWIRYKLAFLFLLVSFVVSAQQYDTIKVSVDSLLKLAINQNLSIKSDKFAINIAQHKKEIAKQAQFPDIKAIVETGGEGNSLSPHSYLSQSYDIRITQPIYHGGKIGASLKSAQIEENIVELQCHQHEDNIKLFLLEKYYKLICEYAKKEIWIRNILQSRRMLGDIRNLKTEGIVTNNDMLRAELHLMNDSLHLNTVLNSIAIISYELNLMTGLEDNLIIQPDLNVWETPLPKLKNYDEYLNRAFLNNPSICVFDNMVKANKCKVRIAKADNLPEIDFIGENRFGRPFSGFGFDRFNNHWSLGVSVSIPVSSLYKSRGNIRKALNELYSSELSVHINKQEIQLKVKDAHIRHIDAVNRLKTIELAIKQADENYRIMKNRYLNQLAILTDLLDADALCLDTRFQWISAKVEAITTYYELKLLCGEL